MSALRAELTEATANLGALRSELDAATAAREAAEKAVLQHTAQADALAADVKAAEQEHAAVQEQHAALQQEHATALQQHAAAQEEHAFQQREHAALQDQHAALQQEHAAAVERHAAALAASSPPRTAAQGPSPAQVPDSREAAQQEELQAAHADADAGATPSAGQDLALRAELAAATAELVTAQGLVREHAGRADGLATQLQQAQDAQARTTTLHAMPVFRSVFALSEELEGSVNSPGRPCRRACTQP